MLLFILLILFLKENSQPFCKEHSKTKGDRRVIPGKIQQVAVFLKVSKPDCLWHANFHLSLQVTAH